MSLRQIPSKQPIHVTLKNTESKYRTPTAPEDPVLPGLFVFQGMRGSGKSYSCVQMCRHFEKMGYIQRMFLLCPTAGEKDQKETIYTNLKTLDQKDVCTDIHQFEKALVQVQERVKADWATVDRFLLHKKAYDTFHRGKKMSNEETAVFVENDYSPPSKDVHPKRHMLILDDCQGSSVYTVARKGMLNHLSIKHRHIPLTICFLVQSLVGVPRTIRLNATQYLIFKTSDKTQLDQIYSAFANTVSRSQFDEVYNEATGNDPHGFLYIDVVPKEPWKRFRKGFNHFLVPTTQTHLRKGLVGGVKRRREEHHASDSEQESET